MVFSSQWIVCAKADWLYTERDENQTRTRGRTVVQSEATRMPGVRHLVRMLIHNQHV